ncbi:MAG: ATP-grasp domain-containing protein [Ruminococcaceae bacterium]|nr:ATP-grasp domain-containing protein [Oscillospiraceae bacterium]
MNILLTSAGRRSYLVKYFKDTLKNEGLVHTANSSSLSTAFLYADKTVVTPLIYDENYIPFLLSYCKENCIDALISLFDIDLMILSRHKKDFEEIGTRVIVADESAIDICNDKWNTYNFCLENNINTPKTYIRLSDAQKDLEDEKIDFPLYVKPRWGMGSLSVFKAENETELRVFYEKSKREISKSYLKYESAANPDECVLIQQSLKGQEYGMDVINDLEGNYQNTVIRQKYAMRSGETDAAIIVKNEKINEIGRIISQKLKHPANLDADVFLVGDTPYLLEMNARFGGGYPFSHVAGVNMPLAIIRWLKGEEVSPSLLSAKEGVMASKELVISVFPQEFLK